MSGGQVPTIPADEAGAALAVTRPTLPSAELTDLLDGTVVPLAAIFGLDDQRFRAFALEVARLTRVTEAGRLVVGAYLHRARDQAKRGEWTPFVAELADAMGLKTDTLGKWVLAAERHFGMELAKGANPSRRSPLPGRPKPELGRDPSSPPVSAADASPSSDVAEPEPPATKRAEPDLQAREDPPAPAPITPGATRGAQLSPPPASIVPLALAEACEAVLDVNPVELAVWVKANLTKATAAHGALGRALTDSAGRGSPAQQAARTAAAKAVKKWLPAPPSTKCPHPRANRKPVGNLISCGKCGTVRPNQALLDADGAG